MLTNSISILKSSHLSRQVFSFIVIFGILPGVGLGQKYDFVNYTIEDGLVQSQVNTIVEDPYGMMWISTFGGISRFDGKEFVNYNFGNGLMHSSSELVFCDRTGNIWIAHNGHIQRYDGKSFRTYKITGLAKNKRAAAMVHANDRSIYALSAGKIYKLNEANATFNPTTDSAMVCTAIAHTAKGDLVAAVHKKGIFIFHQGQWSPMVVWKGKDTTLYVRAITPKKQGKGWWALATTALVSCQDSTYQVQTHGLRTPMWCMAEVSKGVLYIGTSKGAYKIHDNQKTEHLTALQGLTDNAIYDITQDREGNLWFGTDGSGIYKYHEPSLMTIDQSIGLRGNTVMALSLDSSGAMWAGSLEHGLSGIKDGTITYHPMPTKYPESNKINVLLTDQKQQLWIGTIGSGLWTYKNNRFNQIGEGIKGFPLNFTGIYESKDGSIWTTSARGVTRIRGQQIDMISDIPGAAMAMYELSPDSMLVCHSNGISILDHSLKIHDLPLEGTQGIFIGNIARWKNYLVFGTMENGIVLWDYTSKSLHTIRCNESLGLSSNMCFSVLPKGDAIYTGTVNGLNKIQFDSTTKKFTVKHLHSANHRLGPECNQNAILEGPDENIWVGTTKGIYIFQPSDSKEILPPRIYLKSIEIFSAPIDSTIALDSIIAWNALPKTLNIAAGQNHLTFTITGIHHSAPMNLLYQYQLVGADTAYSKPKNIASVIYPQLAPGSYTFKARALLSNNPTLYSEEIIYTFTINPKFYQTNWFRFLFLVSLLILGTIIQKYRLNSKARHRRLIDEARLQEQFKIQQRTSEDLHDDLGNKITRLSLLTDILQTKLTQDADQLKIIHQIRENIQGLYMGTKDIIWALAPKQNSLYDAIHRIQNFGSDLFQDSTIGFKSNDPDEQLKNYKPPFEFSRNLIMICKESFHNVLKHSGADAVTLECKFTEPDFLYLAILDNGIGIKSPISPAKKGNGLDNIQKRVTRLGGTLEILDNTPTGTIIAMHLKIPPSEGS